MSLADIPQAYSVHHHQGPSLHLLVFQLRNLVLLRQLDAHRYRLGLHMAPGDQGKDSGRIRYYFVRSLLFYEALFHHANQDDSGYISDHAQGTSASKTVDDGLKDDVQYTEERVV